MSSDPVERELSERVRDIQHDRLWSNETAWFEEIFDHAGDKEVIKHLKNALIELHHEPRWNNDGYIWNTIRHLRLAKLEAEKFCRDYAEDEIREQVIAEMEAEAKDRYEI